jgi:hypothetical protein
MPPAIEALIESVATGSLTAVSRWEDAHKRMPIACEVIEEVLEEVE